jgi:hypothetical protein
MTLRQIQGHRMFAYCAAQACPALFHINPFVGFDVNECESWVSATMSAGSLRSVVSGGSGGRRPVVGSATEGAPACAGRLCTRAAAHTVRALLIRRVPHSASPSATRLVQSTYAGGIISSFAIIFINLVLEKLMEHLSEDEGHHSTDLMNRSLAQRLFLAEFIVTAVLPILVASPLVKSFGWLMKVRVWRWWWWWLRAAAGGAECAAALRALVRATTPSHASQSLHALPPPARSCWAARASCPTTTTTL